MATWSWDTRIDCQVRPGFKSSPEVEDPRETNNKISNHPSLAYVQMPLCRWVCNLTPQEQTLIDEHVHQIPRDLRKHQQRAEHIPKLDQHQHRPPPTRIHPPQPRADIHQQNQRGPSISATFSIKWPATLKRDDEQWNDSRLPAITNIVVQEAGQHQSREGQVSVCHPRPHSGHRQPIESARHAISAAGGEGLCPESGLNLI